MKTIGSCSKFSAYNPIVKVNVVLTSRGFFGYITYFYATLSFNFDDWNYKVFGIIIEDDLVFPEGVLKRNLFTDATLESNGSGLVKSCEFLRIIELALFSGRLYFNSSLRFPGGLSNFLLSFAPEGSYKLSTIF